METPHATDMHDTAMPRPAFKARLKTRLLHWMLNPDCGLNRAVINQFHRIYYYAGASWQGNTFAGAKVQQMPFDLWNYQQILHSQRPAFLVQTGVFCGGSVLFFASLLDMLQAPPDCLVIGVDIKLRAEARRLDHPRIRLVEGSSTDPVAVGRVRQLTGDRQGMVILDSDHRCNHVREELDVYAPLVALGQYLVVEDTNLNGHPVEPSFGPGPREAVDAFLVTDRRFVRDDHVWKRQLFSHHQYGWLRRVEGTTHA